MRILSKAHLLFVFCSIQVVIFPIFTSPATAQAPEYSTKKCLIIIKSYARKLKNAQIDGDQETYSTLIAKSNRFFRRRPECADALSRLVGPISSPTPTYTPTRAQSANSSRAYSCQNCLRNLKSCRQTLADMKSSNTRTYTAESGMEVSCMRMETQCQEMCSGL